MLNNHNRDSIVTLADAKADAEYEARFEATMQQLVTESDPAKRRELRDQACNLAACWVSTAARAAAELTAFFVASDDRAADPEEEPTL